jgi:hypothetical protein
MKNLVEKLSVEDFSGSVAEEAWADYQASKCPQCGAGTYRIGGYCSRNCEKDSRDNVNPG